MVDEVNKVADTSEVQSDNQNPSEVGEDGEDMVSQTRVTELEGWLARKDAELAEARARIAELEETVVGRDGDIADLKQSQAELGERLSNAVASYRAMVLEASPGVMEEFISGDTIEAINESLEKAKIVIGKVREGLETEISLAKVPAGAPERRTPDLSALSPREKIQYAVGGRR